MRNCLIGIVIAAALSLSACSGRSTRSNPTAFCSAVKKNAVEFAGLEDNPTPSLVKGEAAAVQKLVGIAPKEIESAVQTEADAYSQLAKTGNSSELQGKKFAAADDQINMWITAYCKQ